MAFASDKGRQGAAGVSTGGYTIDNSIRLNDDDSAYLSRTPASAGNRKTWTWSGWVKRTTLSNQQFVFLGSNTTGHGTGLLFRDDDTIQILDYVSGYNINLITSAKYRDVGAWYHIVLTFDTTQATSSDRVKLYINGDEVTSFGTSTYPVQNNDYNVNTTSAHYLKCGTWNGSINDYSDGYLAEVNFIDGQALDPSNFGETGDYGEWKPIKYTGTYGTNGFYLDFENSGSLGADVSGNSNNWTPNNLAATDQMLDSPTNNFCTLNPIQVYSRSGAIESTPTSEGNLSLPTTSSQRWGGATMPQSSGKWYAEITCTVVTDAQLGIYPSSLPIDAFYYALSGSKAYNTDGSYWSPYPTAAQTYSSWTTGDIIGIALDLDNGKVWFSKNGSWQGGGNPSAGTSPAESGLSGEYQIGAGQGSNGTVFINFGQDSSFAGNKTAQGNADDNGYGDFYYAPPTGYLALCTQNLPEPTVVPSEHFNTVLYTGTGSNQSITGVGFAPDFVWGKNRSTSGSQHVVNDSVRGTAIALYTDLTNAEASQPLRISSLDSDGFSVGTHGSLNGSGNSIVAWNWKANGAGVSNTNGTITSTVSANADAGFSIVSYTDTSSVVTIGHGLSSAPELIIVKKRNNPDQWTVGHKDLNGGSSAWNYGIPLNTTASTQTNSGFWNNTAPTSTVFTNGTWGDSWQKIAYCFHSVDGYSKVGSYTGNGSTDGTFVHCGFRPAYVMIKGTDTTYSWDTFDNKRDPINDVDGYLAANDTSAENHNAVYSKDFLSNGFKLRTAHATENGSGNTYIYIAFAEHPFKHSNAR